MEIKRKDKETSVSVIRRFTRCVKQSGNLVKVRSSRYATRAKSGFTKKKEALKRIARSKIRTKLYKLGKLERK